MIKIFYLEEMDSELRKDKILPCRLQEKIL